jgi:hypothetical protein
MSEKGKRLSERMRRKRKVGENERGGRLDCPRYSVSHSPTSWKCVIVRVVLCRQTGSRGRRGEERGGPGQRRRKSGIIRKSAE